MIKNTQVETSPNSPPWSSVPSRKMFVPELPCHLAEWCEVCGHAGMLKGASAKVLFDEEIRSCITACSCPGTVRLPLAFLSGTGRSPTSPPSALYLQAKGSWEPPDSARAHLSVLLLQPSAS